MRQQPHFPAILLILAVALCVGCRPVSVGRSTSQAAPAADSLEQPMSSDPLIAGFQKTTTSSVSDAVDQVVKRSGFMSFDMRPYVGKAFVGRAVTALVKPAKSGESTSSTAIAHSVDMIDQAKPGEVGVIVFEDGQAVSALGGLMGTAAKSRGMVGMVLDGAIRDIGELRRLGLPVFARAASPASAVGRYKSVAKNVPITCAGVTVNPGDIIVAGEDGVVVVPLVKADEVLKAAQAIDERESKMVPFIQQEKSLQKAVGKFNRI